MSKKRKASTAITPVVHAPGGAAADANVTPSTPSKKGKRMSTGTGPTRSKAKTTGTPRKGTGKRASLDSEEIIIKSENGDARQIEAGEGTIKAEVKTEGQASPSRSNKAKGAGGSGKTVCLAF
jgi:hypothetical protein